MPWNKFNQGRERPVLKNCKTLNKEIQDDVNKCKGIHLSVFMDRKN